MIPKIISSSKLRHGDVLLYDHRIRHSSLFVDLIHFVTRAPFEHASIVWDVDGTLYILEQLEERIHSLLKFYYDLPNEKIFAFRPRFLIPTQDPKVMFRRESYGYSTIADCLTNHVMRGLTFGKWEPKPIIRKALGSQSIDCSGLVAQMLKLTETTSWCKYPSVVEPGTLAQHPESLLCLGEVIWN